MKLNSYIDHTVLKATTLTEDIKKLCAEAKEYNSSNYVSSSGKVSIFSMVN